VQCSVTEERDEAGVQSLSAEDHKRSPPNLLDASTIDPVHQGRDLRISGDLVGVAVLRRNYICMAEVFLEVHYTISQANLFQPGDCLAIDVSKGITVA